MTCPNCSSVIDADEEELDEGDPVSCDECGADLKVASLNPVELEAADEDEDEDDEDEDFDDEDEDDEDVDELEEGEESEKDEWA